MSMPALRARARDDTGGVAIEFGIMFPIMALLISGLVAFALAWNLRLTLTQAAREGVRVYALVPGGDWQTATTTAAQGLSGLTLSNSGNCDPTNPGTPRPYAWVNVARDFTLDFAFVPSRAVTLQGRAVMRCGG